jgi:hypothetical protein
VRRGDETVNLLRRLERLEARLDDENQPPWLIARVRASLPTPTDYSTAAPSFQAPEMAAGLKGTVLVIIPSMAGRDE